MSDLATGLMLLWLKTCAKQEKVNPAFAAAVFHVESRDKNHEFRFGPLGRKGKFIGPAGINRCFRSKWNIDDWRVNVLVGVRALKNTLSLAEKKKRLQKYNAEFSESYWREVLKAEAKYQRYFLENQ